MFLEFLDIPDVLWRCRRRSFHYWKAGRSSPSGAIVQALLDAGLAAVAEAERAEAQGAAAIPVRSRRKTAVKPRAVAKATARSAKPVAAKRPARRRA
jgi:hypothetical protein